MLCWSSSMPSWDLSEGSGRLHVKRPGSSSMPPWDLSEGRRACFPGETMEGPRCVSHGGRPPWETHRGNTRPTPLPHRPSRQGTSVILTAATLVMRATYSSGTSSVAPVHPRSLILAGCRASSLSIKQTLAHTTISNHFAHNKHEGETASWAGNSPNVAHHPSKALVKEADAKEFWEITPDNVAQTIPFPTPAAASAAN